MKNKMVKVNLKTIVGNVYFHTADLLPNQASTSGLVYIRADPKKGIVADQKMFNGLEEIAPAFKSLLKKQKIKFV